jgi:hypothetical protein
MNISRISKVQESTMFDTCNIISSACTTQDAYGENISSASSSASSICGIEWTGGDKTINGALVKYDYDATLRIPLSPAISKASTITLTKQNNEVVSISFNIQNISLGHGIQLLKIKRIEV